MLVVEVEEVEEVKSGRQKWVMWEVEGSGSGSGWWSGMRKWEVEVDVKVLSGKWYLKQEWQVRVEGEVKVFGWDMDGKVGSGGGRPKWGVGSGYWATSGGKHENSFSDREVVPVRLDAVGSKKSLDPGQENLHPGSLCLEIHKSNTRSAALNFAQPRTLHQDHVILSGV